MDSGEIAVGYAGLFRKCMALKQKLLCMSERRVLEFYWSVGNEIARSLGGRRRTYGGRTLMKLSEDTGISKTNLYSAIALAGKFKLRELSTNLSWGQYKTLLTLPDEKARSMARMAAEKRLSPKALRNEVARARKKSRRRISLAAVCRRIASGLSFLCGDVTLERLQPADGGGKDVQKLFSIIQDLHEAEKALNELEEEIRGRQKRISKGVQSHFVEITM